MYRSFESIKNLQRFDFLKIFVILGGNAPPSKNPTRDCSATLPNRSGRYQGTTPTTWLNFYTPCKSQLQNAWPVSPTRSTGFESLCGNLFASELWQFCLPRFASVFRRRHERRTYVTTQIQHQ